ncbi:hypothetical protein NSQ43_13220 [Sporosarcina sp. FSL W8-0480]|uniref:hypothetical protein n=1 Tax=Sporosarcina sp. FSL W8-0480 TaxID=2954701 RepID=UPI0030D6EEFE
MTKRGAGIAFVAISALLISVKYISAAIFGSGVSSWDKELFDAMLSYVGNTLNIFSLLSLLVGVSYIAWGEYEELKRKKETNM